MSYEELNYGAIRDDFQGDFLGFTFNGRHSSEFGLVRTSSSNRYDRQILPNMQDKTVQVPDGDGTYYFGSYYTQKPFSIPVAFDSMSQEQYDAFGSWLGDRGVHELIFDEADYKEYRAKCTGTPNLKFLCFETEQGDVYKGEGTITFTAYFPFAVGQTQTSKRISLNNLLYSENSELVQKIFGLVQTPEQLDTIDKFLANYTILKFDANKLRSLPYSTLYFYLYTKGSSQVYLIDESGESVLKTSPMTTIAFDYGPLNNYPMLCGYDLGIVGSSVYVVVKAIDWIKNGKVSTTDFMTKIGNAPVSDEDCDFIATIVPASEATEVTLALNQVARSTNVFTWDEVEQLTEKGTISLKTVQFPGRETTDQVYTYTAAEASETVKRAGVFQRNIYRKYSYTLYTTEDLTTDPIVLSTYIGDDMLTQQAEDIAIFCSALNDSVKINKMVLTIPENENITKIVIDTYKMLVTVAIDGAAAVRNDLIKTGDFFKIPASQLLDADYQFEVTNGTLEVEYQFLYY